MCRMSCIEKTIARGCAQLIDNGAGQPAGDSSVHHRRNVSVASVTTLRRGCDGGDGGYSYSLMTNVRTQYRETYAPRTISKALLKALVKALVDFKPGLPTTSRKIRARAISAGKTTDLEGSESWKVTDPHSLADLEHVRVELLLTSAEHRRCELHVEFRSGHIAFGVSDNETGWGKGVFEDALNLLGTLGISSKGLNEKLRRAYHL